MYKDHIVLALRVVFIYKFHCIVYDGKIKALTTVAKRSKLILLATWEFLYHLATWLISSARPDLCSLCGRSTKLDYRQCPAMTGYSHGGESPGWFRTLYVT